MIPRITGGLRRLAARLERRALPYVTQDAMTDELRRRRAITSRLHKALSSGSKIPLVKAASTPSLIKELRRRGELTAEEAETLLIDGTLADLYGSAESEDEDGIPPGERIDGTAYKRASAAIRYGDLDEALLQVGRILPGLDRLPDLARSKKEA